MLTDFRRTRVYFPRGASRISSPDTLWHKFMIILASGAGFFGILLRWFYNWILIRRFLEDTSGSGLFGEGGGTRDDRCSRDERPARVIGAISPFKTDLFRWNKAQLPSVHRSKPGINFQVAVLDQKSSWCHKSRYVSRQALLQGEEGKARQGKARGEGKEMKRNETK